MNSQQVQLIRQGAEAWNRWRTENKTIRPDVSGADLGGAALNRVDLSGADLSGAYLIGAHLLGPNLGGTNLGGANFSGAYLAGANLIGANLVGANLVGANLSGAYLSEAKFGRTILGISNLTGAKGLDTCVHHGPSILDYQTLVQSGQLPLAFLRGCGLPDKLIDYLPSLLNEAIQFYSCFISYSTKDQEFAERLHADLQSNGVRCWFAPHQVQGGKKLHEQIDEAIRLYDKLLLILSEASMESEWVKTEIAKARKCEASMDTAYRLAISKASATGWKFSTANQTAGATCRAPRGKP